MTYHRSSQLSDVCILHTEKKTNGLKIHLLTHSLDANTINKISYFKDSTSLAFWHFVSNFHSPGFLGNKRILLGKWSAAM